MPVFSAATPVVLLAQWVDSHAIWVLLLLLLLAACMLRWRAQGRAAWLWQDRSADLQAWRQLAAGGGGTGRVLWPC
jgi:undecaprenyl-diphosphatase